MSEVGRKYVVSSRADAKPTPASQGWSRVTNMAAFVFGLVGGAALFQDGGWPLAQAAAGGFGIAAVTFVILRGIGSERGPASIHGFFDPKYRLRVAAGFGILIAALGGAGVYFHDGAPLSDALLTGGALGVAGFVLGYFPIFTFILSLIGMGW